MRNDKYRDKEREMQFDTGNPTDTQVTTEGQGTEGYNSRSSMFRTDGSVMTTQGALGGSDGRRRQPAPPKRQHAARGIWRCVYAVSDSWRNLKSSCDDGERKRQTTKNVAKVAVVLAAIISLGFSIRFLTEAGEDNFTHQHDEIQNYITEWRTRSPPNSALTYHAQAKKLSVFLGSYEVQKTSEGDEVPTLENDVQLQQKTWDDMKDVYPYAKHLDSYQPVSYE